LVNGVKAYFHSTTPVNVLQQQEIEEKTSSAVAGQVVNQDGAPHGINIDYPYKKSKKRKYA
jgi:hypothetical protein